MLFRDSVTIDNIDEFEKQDLRLKFKSCYHHNLIVTFFVILEADIQNMTIKLLINYA